MKYTVAYGSARTGDYLNVAIKNSQHVPFQGRHDYRYTTACTSKKKTKKWVRAHGQLSPSFISVKPTPSKAKEFASVMAFKEVYDCALLISEIERRLALYGCLLKEYCDKGLKERLWGEVWEAVVCF